MLINRLLEMKNFLQAQLCYQLFLTPIPIKMPDEYHDFTARAREFVIDKRSSKMEFESPRHYVIHRFSQKEGLNPKKVLIAHGWTSRAAYMVRTIRILHKQGYDVYALDFPAHGDAKGFQLPWFDAMVILRDIMNNLGPFYAVIGHSFGGSMLLNTINLAGQLPEWELTSRPERVVLMASPTRTRTPICHFARRLNLSGQTFVMLRANIRKYSFIDINLLNYRSFIRTAEMPVLCIHGQQDSIIDVQESIKFCQKYPFASLALMPDVDHIGILIDKRVENMIGNFLL